MTLPEHVLLKRRLKTLDRDTRQARRCNARGPEDRLQRDKPHADAPQDRWVAHFIDRLAGLIRHIGGKK